MATIFSLIFSLIMFGMVNSQGVVPLQSVKSGGIGCTGMLASYLHQPIANTDLFTGIFYRISILANGHVSWASRTDKFGKMLAFSDYNNLGMYRESGGWFLDTYWAFLETSTLGWYHMVNCGYPNKFLTVSRDSTRLSNGNDKTGVALVIDEIYPGENTHDDFLFKPAYLHEQQSYQIFAKALNTSLVFESETSYSGKSFFLKVEKISNHFPNRASCGKSLFRIEKPLRLIRERQQDGKLANSAACTLQFP